MLVQALRDIPRRAILLLAVALALVTMTGALAAGADAAVATKASPKPTIVLVHGAWADASSWKKVAAGCAMTATR